MQVKRSDFFSVVFSKTYVGSVAETFSETHNTSVAYSAFSETFSETHVASVAYSAFSEMFSETFSETYATPLACSEFRFCLETVRSQVRSRTGRRRLSDIVRKYPWQFMGIKVKKLTVNDSNITYLVILGILGVVSKQ